MQAIADAGYLVVAPDHRDATCGSLARWFTPAEAPFGHPEQWTPDAYRDRHDDIVRLIAALHIDRDFGSRIDWSRLALAGHSLGGYTVMGLGGAWPQWAHPGSQSGAGIVAVFAALGRAARSVRPYRAGDVSGRHARFRHHPGDRESRWCL
jgi:predicted dienelactone hydrolase